MHHYNQVALFLTEANVQSLNRGNKKLSLISIFCLSLFCSFKKHLSEKRRRVMETLNTATNDPSISAELLLEVHRVSNV